MRYLVTGGTGYVGKHLVEVLLSQGHQVVVFDQKINGNQNDIQDNLVYVPGDIVDFTTFERIDGSKDFDGIFHLAAKKSVTESVSNPYLYEQTNVTGTKNVIEYSNRNNIRRIVFTSSAAVYGATKSGLNLKEEDMLLPNNLYGETKFNSEKMLQTSFANFGISSASLRCFNIVGAKRPELFDFSGENIFPILMRSIINFEKFNIYGKSFETKDGTAIRDYVHVSDVVTAHVKAMNLLEKNTNSICVQANVGSGVGTSVMQLIELIQHYSGKKLQIDFAPSRPGEIGSAISNIEYATKLLDWMPQHRINDALIETLTAYQISPAL